MEAFNDIFEDCTSLGTKIPKEDYLTEGKHIVIDQGQKTIAGYTDLEEGLYEDVPAIIFGDHTRIIKYVDEPFFLGADGVKLLKSKRKDANYKYLYYALKNARIPDTGYNRHFKWLKEISIEYPDCGRQQDIVNVLDKVSLIIEKRNLELEVLDELIKARFVEMFGDPECGEAKYSTKKLEDLSNKISDGVHAKPVYTESGRPFLSVVNINKGFVDFTDCKYVSEDAYQKMIKSTNPEKGDVLYTKVGATYGIPAYVDTEVEFCLYVSVCLIKPKHEAINSRFLSIQMGMPSVKHQADARIKGIGVPDLHLNQIREFDIICPPRELQDRFVAFVEQVDKSKVAVQKALDETQTLFDCLMQEYFG